MSQTMFQSVSSATDGESADATREAELVKAVSENLDADLFIFSGSIDRRLASTFIKEADAAKGRENAVLILCTLGGDADAAYIIARFLKRKYKKFILYVFGYCKSAGTIIALGADEIVMSDRGELGPLDVQLLKSDELIFRSSGLDITQALQSLSNQSYEIFETHFLEVLKKGGGAITTHTAAEIASNLAVGLFAPITEQIDPLRVGEVERSMDISYQYGIRLNKNQERVNMLVRGYPSHSFVIDFEEAKDLFGNVREPSDVESQLERFLRNFEKEQHCNCVSFPNEEGMVGYLSTQQEAKNAPQQDSNGDSHTDTVRAGGKQPKPDGDSNQASGENTSTQPVGKTEAASEAQTVATENGRQR